MLPAIAEAEKELRLAGELNPGPWVKHSVNVGIAAMNIAHKTHIMETYIKGWDITFKNKGHFEAMMGCSIYDVLPDIGRTTLLCPPPWKPPVRN